MTVNYLDDDDNEHHEFPKLKARFDEDPARFLQSNKPLALARIAGVRDEELLEAYRAVAKQILSGKSKSDVLDALDDRKRELTGEPITPEPTLEGTSNEDRDPSARSPTPEPVATDGGQTIEPEPEGEPKTEDTSESETTEPSGQDTHPDATALESGQVLVVTLENATEYVWPAAPDADQPYVLEIHDDNADPEQLELSKRDLFERVRNDETETRPTESIAVDAPSTAALGGQ